MGMFGRSPTLTQRYNSVSDDLSAFEYRPGSTHITPSPPRSRDSVDLTDPGLALLEQGALQAPLLRLAQEQAAGDANGQRTGKQPAQTALERKLNFAYTVSWIVNIVLLGSKAYAWWISSSKAVLASLVDSFVDLISQVVIFVAESRSRKMDSRFPVGQARLETIGVLGCALIMAIASFQVIEESTVGLYEGFVLHNLPEVDPSIIMYSVLGTATALKLICYIQCAALASSSDSMVALAEDHLNDILSNVAAAITAAIATEVAGAWWTDPAGAIAISIYILWRWFDIAQSQVDKIVGRAAPPEFMEQLTLIGSVHHEFVQVDCIRAYHMGSRFMVEMEIIMPIHFTLKEVHDISLELQHKIEALEPVERAFVHVDYERREQPEHRTERLLQGLPVLMEEVSI